MKHVMIDLETLGTETGCAILSIGAQLFDPVAGTLGATFYVKTRTGAKDLFNAAVPAEKVTAADQPLRIVNPNTVKWWRRQSAEAQQELFSDEISLLQALTLLREFTPKGARPWGNSAAFDISILENAFESYVLNPPWQFWKVLCYRTLKNIVHVEMPFEGVRHNALADATHQAKHAIAIYRHLGLSNNF